MQFWAYLVSAHFVFHRGRQYGISDKYYDLDTKILFWPAVCYGKWHKENWSKISAKFYPLMLSILGKKIQQTTF